MNNSIDIDDLEDDDSDPFDEFANATLEFAITEAEYLFSDENSFHFGVINMAGGVEYLTFSREDVADTDDRLPEVIDALIAENAVSSAQGRLLRDTIEHWNNPPPVIRTIDKTTYYLHSVNHIYEQPVASPIKIQGFVYKMNKTKNGIDYSPEGEHEIVTLGNDWLDNHYPGAHNRLQAGLLMSLAGQELRDYVFTNPELTKDLPDLPSDLNP